MIWCNVKIILDTNIYLSALGSRGKLLDLVESCINSKDIQVFFGSKTMLELEEKLLGERFNKITKNQIVLSDINQFLSQIKTDSRTIESSKNFDLCRDLRDNIILDLAFEVKADYIITGDEDLIILKEFEGTKIMKPS